MITKKSYSAGFLLVLLLLSGCKTELYSKLDESDANAMLAILLNNNISAEKLADKKAGTYFLHVDDSRIPQAVGLLRDHGYPKEKSVSMGEMFKKEGLISSPLEERARVWSSEPALAGVADRLTQIVASFDLNSVWISNASGDAVAEGHAVGVSPFVGANYSDRDYFKVAQQGQNGHQFAVGRVTNRYSLFFSSPILVDGRFVGMVGANFQLSKLTEVLKHAEAFVTDENGVVVLAKDSTLLMKAVPTAQVKTLRSDELDKRYKRRDFETLDLMAISEDITSELYQWQQKTSPYVLAQQTTADGSLRVYVLKNIEEILTSAHRDRLWQFALIFLTALLLSVLIGGGVWYVITTRRQQDKLIQLNKILDQQANTDMLTGLANRRHFMALGEQELSRTIRYGGELSLLMLDIDYFKNVNDMHGHHVGDLVLQKLGDVERGVLGRWRHNVLRRTTSGDSGRAASCRGTRLVLNRELSCHVVPVCRTVRGDCFDEPTAP